MWRDLEDQPTGEDASLKSLSMEIPFSLPRDPSRTAVALAMKIAPSIPADGEVAMFLDRKRRQRRVKQMRWEALMICFQNPSLQDQKSFRSKNRQMNGFFKSLFVASRWTQHCDLRRPDEVSLDVLVLFAPLPCFSTATKGLRRLAAYVDRNTCDEDGARAEIIQRRCSLRTISQNEKKSLFAYQESFRVVGLKSVGQAVSTGRLDRFMRTLKREGIKTEKPRTKLKRKTHHLRNLERS